MIGVIVYFVLLFTIRVGVEHNMSKFTSEKWNSYQELRYVMIEGLEQKYNFVGKKKEAVIEILGEALEQPNRIYYVIKSVWLHCDYYCLDYDENNVITRTYIKRD